MRTLIRNVWVFDGEAVHGAQLPVLTPQTVVALVEAAHAAGLPAIAHALTVREVTIALDAGVDGLAHVYADVGLADPAGPELAARIAAQGVFVVTTLAYFEAISLAASGSREGAQRSGRPLRGGALSCEYCWWAVLGSNQ